MKYFSLKSGTRSECLFSIIFNIVLEFLGGAIRQSDFFNRFYLLIFREGREGRKRGRELQSVAWGLNSNTPDWVLNPQPRRVP